jgi:excisionase family DNA binding protein
MKFMGKGQLVEKEPLLLTVGQAANALGLSVDQVRNMIREGRLTAHVKGRRRRIALSDLERIEPNVIHTLLLTTRQAASMLGAFPQTVRDLGDLGVLTAVRGGNSGTHRRYRFGDVAAAAQRMQYRKNGNGQGHE